MGAGREREREKRKEERGGITIKGKWDIPVFKLRSCATRVTRQQESECRFYWGRKREKAKEERGGLL
jgi:hypothetical protein